MVALADLHIMQDWTIDLGGGPRSPRALELFLWLSWSFNKLLTRTYHESRFSYQLCFQSPGRGAPPLKATDLVSDNDDSVWRLLCSICSHKLRSEAANSAQNINMVVDRITKEHLTASVVRGLEFCSKWALSYGIGCRRYTWRGLSRVLGSF